MVKPTKTIIHINALEAAFFIMIIFKFNEKARVFICDQIKLVLFGHHHSVINGSKK